MGEGVHQGFTRNYPTFFQNNAKDSSNVYVYNILNFIFKRSYFVFVSLSMA